VKDVDIDDPEFRKKMVGDAIVEDDTTLLNKNRKRNGTNYSERDYDRNIKAALEMNGAAPGKASDDGDYSAALSSESDDETSESQNLLRLSTVFAVLW